MIINMIMQAMKFIMKLRQKMCFIRVKPFLLSALVVMQLIAWLTLLGAILQTAKYCYVFMVLQDEVVTLRRSLRRCAKTITLYAQMS